jgi:hypothetical protein
MRLARLSILVSSFAVSLAACFAQSPAQTTSTSTPHHKHGSQTVTSQSALPVSVIGVSGITVKYGNTFRFGLDPLTKSTPIGAAAVPSQLALPSTSAAAAATPSATAAAHIVGAAPPPPIAMAAQPSAAPGEPPFPESCDEASPIAAYAWPTDPAAQQARVDACWHGLRHDVETVTDSVISLRNSINQNIRAAAAEQQCYVEQLAYFSEPILSLPKATALVALATANQTPGTPGGCVPSPPAGTWDLSSADDDVATLLKDQQMLTDLSTAPGFSTWSAAGANANANTALKAQLQSSLTEVTAYSNQTAAPGNGSFILQSLSDYQKLLQNNAAWRTRLQSIALPSQPGQTDPLEALVIEVGVNPCHQWYGAGRTDTIQLQATDLYTANATPQAIALATNTCNPPTIASTGVGVTFLANPTYAFVPGSSGTTTTTSGTTTTTAGPQVIGESSVNRKSPLYTVLYNVDPFGVGHNMATRRGFEAFLSGGVGLVSSSSTTSSDFVFGGSVALARRVVFVTFGGDFGQRQELNSGFALGDQQNALTSVPTHTAWRTGFIVCVSFGIAPSS